jgi:hypothetical protein
VPSRIKTVVEDPDDCRGHAVSQALETTLKLASAQEILALAYAPPVEGARWSGREVRNLFGRLDRLIESEIVAGRELLAAGQLEQAAMHLRRAHAIDPSDSSSTALLNDLETSLQMSQELSQRMEEQGHWQHRADATTLEANLHPDRRKAVLQELRDEEATRLQLSAALDSLSDDAVPPSSEIIAALRASEIRDPDALGVRLAQSKSESEVETRTLVAPDGAVVARYYFEEGDEQALLREDDWNGDGRPDRWTAYLDDQRREVWQEDDGSGNPRLHMTYGPGRGPVEKIVIDNDHDGRPDRIFLYRAGQLHRESRDTNGDGRLDQIEYFDPLASLVLREEDLDGDGEIDVRTHYRAGRMVSREIINPSAMN